MVAHRLYGTTWLRLNWDIIEKNRAIWKCVYLFVSLFFLCLFRLYTGRANRAAVGTVVSDAWRVLPTQSSGAYQLWRTRWKYGPRQKAERERPLRPQWLRQCPTVPSHLFISYCYYVNHYFFVCSYFNQSSRSILYKQANKQANSRANKEKEKRKETLVVRYLPFKMGEFHPVGIYSTALFTYWLYAVTFGAFLLFDLIWLVCPTQYRIRISKLHIRFRVEFLLIIWC